MKLSRMILIAAASVIALTGCQTDKSINVITTEVPERPAGQSDMVAFAAEPIETVRVGFIGLGMRGPDAVKRFINIPGTKVVALCDIEQERVDSAQQILRRAGLPDAASYGGTEDAWRGLVERDDIDLVYIATDWKHHADMAEYAMQNGKHTAIEVPAAMTLDEIWRLIDTSEKTRRHCMMLENCVYDSTPSTWHSTGCSAKCCTQKAATYTTFRSSGPITGTTGVSTTTATIAAMYMPPTVSVRHVSCSTYTGATE